jgi:hypothetical protein
VEQSPQSPTPDDGVEQPPAPQVCPYCADISGDLEAHLEVCRAATEADWQKQVAAARDLLREDEQKRMRACLEEIRAVCAKYRLSLDIEPARVVLRPVD